MVSLLATAGVQESPRATGRNSTRRVAPVVVHTLHADDHYVDPSVDELAETIERLALARVG